MRKNPSALAIFAPQGASGGGADFSPLLASAFSWPAALASNSWTQEACLLKKQGRADIPEPARYGQARKRTLLRHSRYFGDWTPAFAGKTTADQKLN